MADGRSQILAAPAWDVERAWIARIRAGDYAAFTALFEAYYGRLVAFATHLTGTPDLAEDLVQDIFVHLWERRAEWEVTSSLTAYLRGATRNGALREHRQREVRERLADWIEPISAPRDLEATAHASQVDAIIARAIAALPERCRAVYALRWYDQLTYPEIAHILGISIKTVEAHVTTALRILRPKLRRLCVRI